MLTNISRCSYAEAAKLRGGSTNSSGMVIVKPSVKQTSFGHTTYGAEVLVIAV